MNTSEKSGRHMGAQVLSLVPSIKRRDKPNEQQQELIDVLAEMLEKAEAGTLTSLAFCVEQEGGRHCVGTVGRYDTDRMSALGAAALMHRLIEEASHGNLKGFKRGAVTMRALQPV